MKNVNGYTIDPMLFTALERDTPNALKEMRGDFTPESGCGQEIKKLVDLFTEARRNDGPRGRVSHWNDLAQIVAVEGYKPTTLRAMASAVAHVIQIYIFG